MTPRHHSTTTVRLKVGRPCIGRTAETRMNRESVQPPYLVQPFRRHAHTCAHTHARAQVWICLQVGQGKEVGQFQYWCGFSDVRPLPDPLPIKIHSITKRKEPHHGIG